MSIADWVDVTKVSLFLTHRCNLRCRYCYNGEPFDRNMSWATAKRAIDFAFEYVPSGLLVLSFFGGEPSLAQGLLEQAVAHARREAEARGRKLRFSLPTNGAALDDRLVEFLGANEFQIQVSIDGGREAHDANRVFADGRGSWASVSRNIERMIAANLPVHAVAVVDPKNVRFLASGFLALRNLGLRNIYFTPNLCAPWSAEDWDALDEGLAAVAGQWAECLRAGQEIRLDPFHVKVQAHVFQGARPEWRCSFGKRELAISPRGRIYPCDRIVKDDEDDTLCLGDLDRGLDHQKMAAIARGREQLQPECAACALRGRCTTQCGCNNYEQTGDPGRVSPALCRWERSVIAATDAVANHLFAEAAPAFIERFYPHSPERLVALRKRDG
jgi:uncharacterized protein